jgi:GWxTD domain-containing protein
MQRAFAFALILACLTPAAAAQEMSASRQVTRDAPFQFDALNFASFDSYGLRGRLDVYVHIPYDIITFLRKEEGYAGTFTLTLFVTEPESGTLIKEISWQRTIDVLSFEHTKSALYYDLSQQSLTLPPGPVQLEVMFEDAGSARQFRISRRMSARSFDLNVFAMSDLMLVRAAEMQGPKRIITPHVDANVSMLRNGFGLFYEIYNPFDLAGVRVTTLVLQRGDTLSVRTERNALRTGLNSFNTRIQTTGLGIGAYTARVTITRLEDSTETLASAERPFLLQWMSESGTVAISDLDAAIDQLVYFAKDSDLAYIKESADKAERRKRFDAFWEKNNPVPGATSNRAFIEYYNRVAYANDHFRHYIEGWKTDRGMVYIIFGAPDYVDRHPSDPDVKPYETWEYYDVARRFTFQDESGFGDYRLVYPIWDERTRIR